MPALSPGDQSTTMRPSIRLVEIALVTALLAAVLITWQADRRDRAQLATQLAAAQQTISEAAAHQKDRDAALTQTLAEIAQLKQSVLTPAQIFNALPKTISLPAPIALQAPGEQGTVGARFSASPSEARATNPAALANLPTNPAHKSAVAPADAVIPAADLRPLYNFALDCQACRAKLAAAQSDLADEKTKSAALAQQRDAALRAVKGGSVLRRIARAAKWFVLGAAAGALAIKATGH